MVFDTNSAELAEQWSQIGRFQAIYFSENGDILSSSAKVCPSRCNAQHAALQMSWSQPSDVCVTLQESMAYVMCSMICNISGGDSS